ncbi:hypothetical protein Taro_027755 [Colocasia esculenta]|uniref:Uncharacterized protein n=1 Tax=Colocasia esculenta TaxID=4460 RepID=A0A843V9I7_COLES|nr:hypothetical protein [Colocasia esculenta]
MPPSPPPMPPGPPARPFCHGVFFSSPCTVPSLLLLSLLLLFYLFHHHHLLLLSNRHSSGTEQLVAAPSTGDPRWPPRDDPEHFRQLFLSKTSDGPRAANDSVSAHLRALTIEPHLAGTPSAAPAAQYVLSQLQRSGLRVFYRDYRVLLSYPSRSSLYLVGHPGWARTVKPLDLSEGRGQSAAANKRVVPPYHAYSPSGSVVARPVYVNYGRDEDYRLLAAMGVDVRGCVLVVRRGGGYRGAVVHRAEERGAAAVLIFGEEGSDGDASSRGGVERGTVLLRGPGDPLTPGWAADAGGVGERLAEEDEAVRRRFPAIPSMPVSAATAGEILRAMGGPPVPEEWRGDLQLGGVGGVGPMLLNFTYEGENKLATIRNVFGVVPGREEPDRYVLLGNHRDAWTYGAIDPNSGTATLLEVARRLGTLLSEGWRPRRTIVLCSWDAEEFGMIGSTEWVEDNLEVLTSKAVAYLNVDCAVQGSGLFVSATPQLDKLLAEVTKKVKDPDSDYMTVYQTWTAANGRTNIERLGRADSDFTAFLHHAGIPSLDMYFGKGTYICIR